MPAKSLGWLDGGCLTEGFSQSDDVIMLKRAIDPRKSDNYTGNTSVTAATLPKISRFRLIFLWEPGFSFSHVPR